MVVSSSISWLGIMTLASRFSLLILGNFFLAASSSKISLLGWILLSRFSLSFLRNFLYCSVPSSEMMMNSSMK